ncbi:PepSY-associated TM helix domain-containing protein [Aquamicrobium lusatiense]|uniref:PepSY-associated TM helix domain-containing protein n=1 Tax=Aquamicrobium lusatiense TaxID=89772 RepID=UPI00245615C1|nr:PepSY-associated TM helix domain-containing protein [Aquamicrobium lusatiense]MDH4990670.1 PepSY-associated TM helix domain-containing protein [Aquamicrobium lusatiense]
MGNSFRQSMAWLHTWTGLVVGWVLFFVFVTGTAGYVDDEITRWMKPELPLPVIEEAAEPDKALTVALAGLNGAVSGAKSWTITLPHRSLDPREYRGLSIAWEEMPRDGQLFGRRGRENLDAETGQPLQEPEARDTRGGQGLYQMHFLLHYVPLNAGIKIVGICTMLMLLAVVTGVITHKKIIADFFTFRRGKGQRSWLDAHNVVSVLCLPFFLMITYTGLVFFAVTYMPAPRDSLYTAGEVSRSVLFDELFGRREGSHQVLVAPDPSLSSRLLRAAEAEWGEGRIAAVHIEHKVGEEPSVEFRRIADNRVDVADPQKLRFSAIDGSPFQIETKKPALKARDVLFGLHEGLFANWWLRWLYFVSGLMGCAVIATGLVLWTVKRRTKHAKITAGASRFDAYGLRLVEILNAGTIVGLPMAIAAFFLANRLLPVQMVDRAEWEFHALFLTWGWALFYASLRPLKRAWLELLWMTTTAFAAVPVVNALTTDRHLGVTLPHGDWALAGFDLVMLAFAGGFALMAVKVRKTWAVADEPASVPERQKQSALEEARP